MNFRIFYRMILLLAITFGLFASCSDDDDFTPTLPPVTYGAYILNCGNWGGNNATLQYYDFESGVVSSDVFMSENGTEMGDLGQDMHIYGSKMYIAMSGSSCVHVMDKQGKLLKTIKPLNAQQQPENCRSITSYDGKVYVTLFDGYLLRLDTVNMETTKLLIGKDTYPEGVAVANGKLYVANSAYGKGKTVSVVDINTFEKIKDIDVLLNPVYLTTDAYGDVYLISVGNYPHDLEAEGAVGASLQKIDSKTDKVSGRLTYASRMALHGDLLYVMFSEWNISNSLKYSVFNVKTEQVETEEFIPASKVSNPKCINVDPANGDVYIATSTYGAVGDVYIFSADGTQKKKLGAGYDPTGVYFLTK